jgi:hypothetical protein
VASAAATALAARLTPGATINIWAVDARTGAPVESTCVFVHASARPQEYGEGNSGCTDATGLLTMSRVRPDTYVLFAAAYDGVHG